MFYVELKLENNNKDIYEATHVSGYIIKSESPHPKREIPQCISDTVLQKTRVTEKRDASSSQEIIRLPTAHANLNPS